MKKYTSLFIEVRSTSNEPRMLINFILKLQGSFDILIPKYFVNFQISDLMTLSLNILEPLFAICMGENLLSAKMNQNDSRNFVIFVSDFFYI